MHHASHVLIITPTGAGDDHYLFPHINADHMLMQHSHDLRWLLRIAQQLHCHQQTQPIIAQTPVTDRHGEPFQQWESGPLFQCMLPLFRDCVVPNGLQLVTEPPQLQHTCRH
jgi:hypothetical protein